MKTVLITGGARGIGKAIAEKFAQNNYNVVINYSKSEEAAYRMTQTYPNIRAFKADVSNKVTIQTTIKISNPKILNDVVDWYGENIIVKEKDDEIFVSFNVNEQAFLYWALQYGMNIEVIKPLSTRTKYVDMLKQILTKYEG